MKNQISIVSKSKVPNRKELIQGVKWDKYLARLTDGKAIKVVVPDKKLANTRRSELIGVARPIKLHTTVIPTDGHYVLFAWKD